MKKSVVVAVSFILTLFFINFVLAESISEDLHLNIQTTFTNGTITTGTFAFVFNISNSSNCSDVSKVVYSNSTSLTTDTRGIISYYLPNVTLDYDEQYYLCYYRGGVLKDSTKIARTPYSFTARNISIQGIEVDSNFNLGNYNITSNTGFFDFVGSLFSRVSKVFVNDIDFNGTINGSGNITTTGNITAAYYYGDGSQLTGINFLETDPLWTENYSAYNESWSNTFNQTTNDSINNYIVSNNQSIVDWVDSVFVKILDIVGLVGNWSADKLNYYNQTEIQEINTSMKNYVDWNNESVTNAIADAKIEVNWNANYTNMQNPCSPSFVTGIYENGTFICGTVEQASESDPYWAANYTAFNESWSNIAGRTGLFINYTQTTTTGNITNGTLKGYPAANNICQIEFSGSHMCTIDEILSTISNNISNQNFTATFRANEGAPGYFADASDCQGLTSQSETALGAIWVGSKTHSNTYGIGGLVACNAVRALGCCK